MTALRCPVPPFRQYTCSFSVCFQNKREIYFLLRELLSFNSSTFYQGMPHVLLPAGYLLQAGRKETPSMYLGIRKNIFLPLCFFFFCFQNNHQLVWKLLGLDELQDWTEGWVSQAAVTEIRVPPKWTEPCSKAWDLHGLFCLCSLSSRHAF